MCTICSNLCRILNISVKYIKLGQNINDMYTKDRVLAHFSGKWRQDYLYLHGYSRLWSNVHGKTT